MCFGQGKMKHPLRAFYISVFFKSQLFLLPVLYLFYLSNGLTMGDYFIFQGLIILMNVILQIPSGYIGDRIARKWVITLSYSLFLGRLILWFFYRGFWIVFIGEMLYAVSKGLFDAVESPFIYDVLAKQNKTKKMVKGYERLNFALSAGTAVASIVGVWLWEHCGLKILLGTEFVLISCAIILSLYLPNIPVSDHHKVPFKSSVRGMFGNMMMILKTHPCRWLMYYSGILVAFSHFFFWSFQPLMKLSLVPISLFGVLLFINNTLRSVCSLLTHKVMQYMSLKRLGMIVFVMNVMGILCAASLSYITSPAVCVGLIIYLSVCITLQLIFTIAHISHLQQVAKDDMRTQVASANMLIARLFAALLLMVPKYMLNFFSLFQIFVGYGILFIVVGQFLLRKVKKTEDDLIAS